MWLARCEFNSVACFPGLGPRHAAIIQLSNMQLSRRMCAGKESTRDARGPLPRIGMRRKPPGSGPLLGSVPPRSFPWLEEARTVGEVAFHGDVWQPDGLAY